MTTSPNNSVFPKVPEAKYDPESTTISSQVATALETFNSQIKANQQKLKQKQKPPQKSP